MPATLVRGFIGAILIGALAGCGGGGGGGGGGSPPAAGITWTQGSFASSSTFQDRCATPRSGVDALGRAFTDKAGTLAQELFWLRSWTNETYLWNTEVVDQNPNTFSDRIAYFNVLKTNQTTPSGQPKDRFHFNMTTADYVAQITSAPKASYGAEIRIFAPNIPRDVRVIYTDLNTPASELLAGAPKLARGARLLSVDGIDVVNGGTTQAEVDILINGTFPRTAGETHAFTIQYADGATRSFNMTSANLVDPPVNRIATIDTGASGKVGYILLNTFFTDSTEKAAMDAIAALKAQGVNDVVLDLRYNGGGYLAIASQVSYMIAGPTRTAGKIFERYQFNAAAGTSDPVLGGPNTPVRFESTGLGFSVAQNTPLPTLDLPRVYVLSTSATGSASESVINGLRGADVDVVLIGSKTAGKPFGFYATNNCGITYFSIQLQGLNNKNFGDYPDGFAAANSTLPLPVKIPGCAVADDFSHELGDSSEAMLSAALDYRATGTCPAASGSGLTPAAVRTDGMPMTSSRSPAEDFLRNNRDLRRPATAQ